MQTGQRSPGRAHAGSAREDGNNAGRDPRTAGTGIPICWLSPVSACTTRRADVIDDKSAFQVRCAIRGRRTGQSEPGGDGEQRGGSRNATCQRPESAELGQTPATGVTPNIRAKAVSTLFPILLDDGRFTFVLLPSKSIPSVTKELNGEHVVNSSKKERRLHRTGDSGSDA